MDITVRKQMEAEALLQRAELAHLSRVTMLGELSGSLAHELNQPLAAILSNAQAALRFLARGPGDIDEIRNILRDIVEDDKRAGEVIRRLRTLLQERRCSTSRSGRQRDGVGRLETDAQRADLPARGGEHRTWPRTCRRSSGDRVQLQQVMVNLLTNACDAMDSAEGDRRLTLRTIKTDDGGVKVSVSRSRAGNSCRGSGTHLPAVREHQDGRHGPGPCSVSHDHRLAPGKLWATNNPDRGASLHFTLRPSTDAAS